MRTHQNPGVPDASDPRIPNAPGEQIHDASGEQMHNAPGEQMHDASGEQMHDTPGGRRCAVMSCSQHEWQAWAGRGGPAPTSLLKHVRQCAACADAMRRVDYVTATMTLLKTTQAPANMCRHANSRALRMLRRTTRTGKAAQHALQAQPNLSIWQRAQLHATRVSMSAAAALLLILVRVGIEQGFTEAQALGKALAQAHWDRHIDPDGEWFTPDEPT